MTSVDEAGHSEVPSPSQKSEADASSKGENADQMYEIGGRSKEPCYCLLDGFFEDPESGEMSRITIPITKLPVTIGRSHDKDIDDPHFVGLGSKKALSRKHCRLSYRDAPGGKVEWDANKQELAYKEPAGGGKGKQGHAALNLDQSKLPDRGFFVVECLGKNRILVNQGRVEQGNAAVLASGSSLRISSYTLYFLRPTDSNPVEHVVILAPTSSKKRKTPDSAPSSSAAAKKGSNKAQQDELDSLPVENLLEKMTEAIDNNEWERRHQLIGATIALRAVRDCALDPNIQSVALDGGVSRSEVMVWIEESSKYSTWVQQMLTKMEPRSYQAAITKCLLKGGFTRTGSSGRYIKWFLPKDIPISPQASKRENKKATPSKSKDIKAKNEELADKDNGDEEENDDMEEKSKGEQEGGDEDEEEDGGEESEGDDGDANSDEDDVEDEGAAKDEEEEGDEEGKSDSGSDHKKGTSPVAGMGAADDSSDDEI
jgi:hypothetical protein